VAFQEAMSRCGLLICQAGLYTPFEAMKMGVPFALTYPMSFTQDRQGEKFREMGVECCQSTWIDKQSLPIADVDIEVIEERWFVDSANIWNQSQIDKIEVEVLNYLQQVLMNPVLTDSLKCDAPSAFNAISHLFE
jgi:hypothetical protein